MKILKIIGIGLLSLIVLAVIAVSVMSPKSHIEKSIVVNAAPAAVFQQVANFRNFNTWSPWNKMDPEAKNTYEGPEMGLGAKMIWSGEKTGTGSQEVIEFEEGKRVKSRMVFGGFEGDYFSEFLVEPVADGTRVTWYYDSDVSSLGAMNSAIGKFAGSLMKGGLEKQYEEGLADLKKLAEALPTPVSEPALVDSTSVQ